MAAESENGDYADGRGSIKGRICITERPEVVEKRCRLGDIEVDLMMGKAHKSALLVLTDRTTLLTKIRKVTSRQAAKIADCIIAQLSSVPSAFIKP